RSVSRLRAQARAAEPWVQETASALAARLNSKQAPIVRVHTRVAEPCLCGFIRPVILLPECWVESFRGEALDAILAHEIAHAVRRDQFLNLAQRLLEMLFFFQPAVFWLSRALRREREFSADSLAVRITCRPLALAKALESVASLRLSTRGSREAGSMLG